MAIAVLLMCLVVCVPRVLSAPADEARNAVSNADHSLRMAFERVHDAENAGANVSGLIVRLNEAGFALTSAEAALQMGNYSYSLDEAASCETLAQGVANDAVKLKEQSSLAGSWQSVASPFVLPGIVAGVFVLVLFLTWGRFKGSYNRKLLKSRPEVAK
jgi:hypothetical protein